MADSISLAIGWGIASPSLGGKTEYNMLELIHWIAVAYMVADLIGKLHKANRDVSRIIT